MVKPLQARRLPRQSTVSLREEDLNTSSAEQTTGTPPVIGDRTNNHDDHQFVDEPTLSTSPTSNGSLNPTPSPAHRVEDVGGGDCSVALDSAPTTEDTPNTAPQPTPSCSSCEETRPPGNDPTQERGEGRNSEHNHFSCSYDNLELSSPHTAAIGRDLYLRLVREEIRARNVRVPACLNPWEEASLDRRYLESLSSSAQAHHNLREVANVFSNSSHRELVRQKAAAVNIEQLDYDSFQNLLFGLFQEDGITSERVVVLFFFCADLTVRALQDQLANSFHILLDWSLFYFSSSFAQWVERQGGWAAVLDQSANHLYMAAKIGLVCAGIVALYVYIRNAR